MPLLPPGLSLVTVVPQFETASTDSLISSLIIIIYPSRGRRSGIPILQMRKPKQREITLADQSCLKAELCSPWLEAHSDSWFFCRMWPWSELCTWPPATSSPWPCLPWSAPRPSGPPGNATLCSQQPLSCAKDGGTL